MIYTAETTLRKIHDGKDGEKIYIKYATDPYGIMSDTPQDGFDYLGICQSSALFPPTNMSAYTWMKYKGDPGQDGQSGRPGDPGKDGVSSYMHIKFSDDGGETFTSNDGEDPGAWFGVYTDADPVDSNVPAKYQWTKIAGEKGTDSTSIILTNETHAFQGGDNEVLPATATSKVIAHTGTVQVPVSIGTPTVPTGMTFTIDNNNTVNAGFTVSIDGTLQQRSGSIAIPITISGMEFTKDFTWTVSMRGEQGEEGATCNVSGEQIFKYLSDATAPTQESLTLTAEYNNATHKEWQYKNGDGAWTSYSPAQTNVTISISPTDPCWNNGNTAVIRAIDTTGNIYDAISLLKVRDGNTGEAAIVGYLSNDSHRIPTDGEGNNGNYFGASTTMSVFQGTTDISDTFTYTASASEGITGSLSGRTYTVTSMTVDSGYVDITAKRTGYPDVVKRFNLSLLKSATAYWLVTNANVIFKNDSGLDPTVITMNGKCKSGDSSIMDYAARFEVYHNDDLVYSSTIDESTYSYTIPSDTTSIRIVMKEAGGTGVILDEQNIPVVTDGRPGYDGYTVYLTNQNESFPCDSDGNIVDQIATSTTVIAYKGIEEMIPVIGTLPTVPGLQLSKIEDENGKSMIMIVALAGSELAQNGSFEIPITVDGKPFTALFSWTKLLDATGLKEEVETIKETMFNIDRDKHLIEGIVRQTQITVGDETKSISEQFSKFSQSLTEITTEVSDIRVDFNGEITSLQTKITQTADKLDLIATDGESSSEITLTKDFIELVSGAINFDGILSFYNSVATGTDKTEINGDKITTGIIKSTNYAEPTEDSSPYSVSGTALDLNNGYFYSPYFTIDADGAHFNGDGEFTGTIHATGGSFDGDITALGTITGGTFVGGLLRDPNYAYNSGNFAVQGMEINLSNGTIRTKNTFLDSYGILHVNGIEATNGSFSGTVNATDGSFSGTISSSTITGGTITGATISGNTIKGGSIEGASISGNDITGGTIDGTTITGGSINIGYGAFTVDSSGHMISNSGEFSGDIDAKKIIAMQEYGIYFNNISQAIPIIKTIEWTGESDSYVRSVCFGVFTQDYASNNAFLKCHEEYNDFEGLIRKTTISGNQVIISTMDEDASHIEITEAGGVTIYGGLNVNDGYIFEQNVALMDRYAAKSHSHSGYASSSHTHIGLAYAGTENVVTMSGTGSGSGSGGRTAYTFRPNSSISIDLGNNGNRWGYVFTVNGMNQSSDLNEKTNIRNFDERYEKAYMEFEPVLYMWKNMKPSDDHDRVHSGFIAQQIEDTCNKYGITSESFGAICKANLEEPTEDGRTVRYGLNYSQFIALNTHMIQKLYKTISTLQEKVESLEKQLSAYTS